MPRLTAAERERAVGMVQLGATHTDVATRFGCTRLTITRLMQRLRQTGRTVDRPRTGRPRVTTPAEDRHIRLLHLRNHDVTVTLTAATALGHRISRQTVYRRLRHHGIRARHPYRGPLLTPQHRINRQVWARRVLRWQRREWARVLFSDESRFCVYKNDGRQRVYRRLGERLAPNCVHQVRAFGGGGLMVWGGICGDVKTPLVVIRGNLNAQRYCDLVLRPVVVPSNIQHPTAASWNHFATRQCETPHCETDAELPCQRQHSSFAMASMFPGS